MKTFVALLRGINVGGNSKVKMSELQKCFEDLGFSNVRTYINSGNAIFETDLASLNVQKIESSIKKHFGFEVKVIVKSLEDTQAIVAKTPKEWVNNSDQKTDVIFLWENVDSPGVLSQIEVNGDVDNLIYVKGAIVWNIDRKNYNKSRMHKFIGTHIYKNMTARNINTVRKLESLMM